MDDDMVLVLFLMEHGWDYERLPSCLNAYSKRRLQRMMHRMACECPDVAKTLRDVCIASLIAVPPRRYRKRNGK